MNLADQVDYDDGEQKNMTDDLNGNDLRSERISQATVRLTGLTSHGPSWRWARAQNLVSKGTARRATDYGPILWQIVNHIGHVRDGLHDQLFGDRIIDVAAVEAIHYDPYRRLAIEARLLARMDPVEVAASVGLHPMIIDDYCDVFFDVMDRLDARSWIVTNIIESKHESVCYRRKALYRAAYFGGQGACDHMLTRMHLLGTTHDLTTLQGRELEQLELLILGEIIAETDRYRLATLKAKFGSLGGRPATTGVTVSQMLENRVTKYLCDTLENKEVTAGQLHPASKPAKQRQRRRSA
ncbi:hypothetical protein [Novipirellula artificiosorum]|uniref:Uncharacterized protein n=1 Tax=Novipirellula artificiosorum TaxID=2528016 RepID=A0A5C6CZ36_9BACT|nr:hypothetical protein [Novipirellula artificiosorum]TWU27919.1 hypothetical protein Poly41_70380 [Novipirellula artificiosorum]